MKRVVSVWIVAAAATFAGTAWAQEPADEAGEAAEQAADTGEDAVDDAIADAVEDAPPEADAPASEVAADAQQAAADAKAASEQPVEEALDPDDPLYWSKMRDIYAYQPRAFLKERRFGITVYGGLIPNNIFEQYFPVGVRLNYFILENIGLELAGSYAFKARTNLEPLITESGGVSAQRVLIGDTQVSHSNFGIVWSPFYGKTSFYDNALNYFDIFLFAGAGVVVKETQTQFNAPAEREIKPEGALGAGMAFFLGDSFTLRADFRQFIFEKVAGIGGVANPSEVSVGLGYFF